MLSIGTLVPEQPCYVFHTHTHKDTQHTQEPLDRHTHLNIY